MPALL